MASKLNLPKSNTTVRVRMVDTTALMTIAAQSFIDPVQPGHELINITDVAFLIEHERSGKKLMFDLGCRKDYWNLPPVIQKRLGDVIPGLKVKQDVSEILEAKGITLSSISSIIWSHYHWDHTGNPSLFPTSTSITVGPGVTHAHPSVFPGYPDLLKSPLSASDFKQRFLHEIGTFETSVGPLPAHDYFGDGSFYLLDTPGHCTGHICGLARTTHDTFVLMGGDICHFAGDFRPSDTIPLPDPIPRGVLDHSPHFPIPCPAEIFTSHHPRESDESKKKTTPWYSITDHHRAAYIDPPLARTSVNKMQLFDDSPYVLVCIAHDPTLLEVLPTLNKNPESDLEHWKSKGWKERCHWGWLNELPRDEKPGRKAVVEGFWRDGKWWDYKGWKKEQAEKGRL
jgi:glyoxylase-like metal-dependent hydrolase (beta-lactamase superfamily II)